MVLVSYFYLFPLARWRVRIVCIKLRKRRVPRRRQPERSLRLVRPFSTPVGEIKSRYRTVQQGCFQSCGSGFRPPGSALFYPPGSRSIWPEIPNKKKKVKKFLVLRCWNFSFVSWRLLL
jgi:hypothetical protein